MQNIELDYLNYISKKLVKSTQNVWDKLEDKYKLQLNNTVESIMKILEEKQYFKQPFITNPDMIKYTLISSDECTVEEMGVVDNSVYIRKQLNRLNIYELLYRNDSKETKITIKIYCNDKDNCDENIKKLMVRLYNMFILYRNKTNHMFNLLNFEYIFYLYNNPRRVNRKKNGREYIEEVNSHKTKCFNTASGVTEHKSKILRTSRIEDCLGLLTHEMLHGTSIIFITNQDLIYRGIEVNFTEAYVNMFAAIVNVYLTCIETDTVSSIKDYLLVELIHSINHSIKYSILQGYTIGDILNKESTREQSIVLPQNVYMYEYIVVKMLLFLNFNDLITSNKEFGDMFLSLDKPWLPTLNKYTDYIKRKFIEYNSNNIDIIKLVDTIHRTNLETFEETDKIDGNMIMAYHAIDTMIINNEIKELYGGSHIDKYKSLYVKYKLKYLNLQKNLLK